MAKLAVLGRWYFSGLALVGLGALVGFLIFTYLLSGQPKVAVITIPSTEINEETAFIIGSMLDYARETDSIKAVAVRLNSGGGGAADSEQLYFKMVQLREKKPVVVSVDGIAASGAYMAAVESNYIYAKPTSFVGSVGAWFVLPADFPPSERIISTGPFKIRGTYGGFLSILEMLKQSFMNIVMAERGDKLTLTPQELSEARLYIGLEGVRLGLIDEIGDDTDAVEKAADLAGIANYDLVDVNVEVARIFAEKLRRAIEPLADRDDLAGALALQPFLDRLMLDPTSDLGSSLDVSRDQNLPQFFYQYAPPAE